MARLNWEKVRQIRAKASGARGDCVRLAKLYGVSRATIQFVINRKTWAKE